MMVRGHDATDPERRSSLVNHVVPDTVATAEMWGDAVDIELSEDEASAIRRAVQKRRREFVTGRACARLALRRLGLQPVPVPTGAAGEPVWPEDVVGSITHCRGYRASAVARSAQVVTLGIDAEQNTPLPPGVLERIASRSELDAIANERPDAPERLLFSAKEAIYKAWFPVARRWLGFDDVIVEVDVSSRRFFGEVRAPAPRAGGVAITDFQGRWHIEAGIICTAVVVLR